MGLAKFDFAFKSTASKGSLFIVALMLQGCFGGGSTPPPPPETDPVAQTLTNPGDSEVCSYTSNLKDDGYSSAIVTYPCNATGLLPATTLTGGYTNTKEQMVWLSEHLTSHGYVVIAMTPTNRFGTPEIWGKAHVAGFNKLAAENARIDSPISNKINLDRRAITGFSMGGGGVFIAAEQLAGQNAATLALAPFLYTSPQALFDAQVVPTMILGSELDEIAKNSEKYYAQLPNIEKGLGMFTGASHYDWYGSGDQDAKAEFRTLVTAFLDAKVKGDNSAYGYLDKGGAEHQAHLDDDWFSAYDYVR